MPFTLKLNNRLIRKGLEKSKPLSVSDISLGNKWLYLYYRGLQKLFEDGPRYWDVLIRLYQLCNTAYHSGAKDSPLTDDEFDLLGLYLKQNKRLNKTVGIKYSKSENVILPHLMPSLEFCRTNAEIEAWAAKKQISSLLLTPKYDGISLYLRYEKGRFVFAATRGNGFEGKDVTRHAMLAPCIPKILSNPIEKYLLNDIDCELRCEIYLPESVFQAKFSRKNGGKLATARNAVAGAFNRNKPNRELLNAMDCRIFEVFSGPLHTSVIKDSELSQMKKHYGLPMTEYRLHYAGSPLNLPVVLDDWPKSIDVLMDGIVCEVNVYGKRQQIGNETGSINPGWARAFKPLKEAVQTTVQSIGYSVSKDNYIKPTINIEPVEIGGVTVSSVNGFNAGSLRDKGIDCGAIITISRRGDTIPHMESVVKSVKWQQPTVLGPLKWSVNDKGEKVDLIAVESGDEHKIQQIIQFFKVMGVEYFDEGNIRKFYKHGFIDIVHYLEATDTFMAANLPGIKEKSAKRIRGEFDKLRDAGVTMPKLMYASGCFGRGFGEDKLDKLFEYYGYQMFGDKWAKLTAKSIAEHVAAVKGFSFDSGMQYSQGLTLFKQFRKRIGELVKIKKINSNGVLHGQTIVFTEFRDERLKDNIKTNGGKYSDSLVKTTTILLRQNEQVESKKVQQALQMGVNIMVVDEFKEKYGL